MKNITKTLLGLVVTQFIWNGCVSHAEDAVKTLGQSRKLDKGFVVFPNGEIDGKGQQLQVILTTGNYDAIYNLKFDFAEGWLSLLRNPDLVVTMEISGKEKSLVVPNVWKNYKKSEAQIGILLDRDLLPDEEIIVKFYSLRKKNKEFLDSLTMAAGQPEVNIKVSGELSSELEGESDKSINLGRIKYKEQVKGKIQGDAKGEAEFHWAPDISQVKLDSLLSDTKLLGTAKLRSGDTSKYSRYAQGRIGFQSWETLGKIKDIGGKERGSVKLTALHARLWQESITVSPAPQPIKLNVKNPDNDLGSCLAQSGI